MLRKWQCRLLSALLCASLIAPNLAVSSYAMESDQIEADGGVLSESLEGDSEDDASGEVHGESAVNAENPQEVTGEDQTPGETKETVSSNETSSEEESSEEDGATEEEETTEDETKEESSISDNSGTTEEGSVSDNSGIPEEKTVSENDVRGTDETVYNLEEEFPDKAFRDIIISHVNRYAGTGYSEKEGTVTASALGCITYLESERNSFSTVAVKDLTGIELLTNLEALNLYNHEITDISNIDWSTFTRLERIYLKGNDISVFPDLSDCTTLIYVDFDENRFTAEEIRKAYSKVPEGFELHYYAFENQRVNGFEVVTEDNYYYYGDIMNLYVQAKGYKSELPYVVKFYVDNTEIEPDESYSSDWMNVFKNTGLTEGEHTLKAVLNRKLDNENGQEVLEEESTVFCKFKAVREDIFSERDIYYIGSNTGQHYSCDVRVYYPTDETVTEITLVRDGKVYGTIEKNDGYDNYYKSEEYHDPRYEKLNYMSGLGTEVIMASSSAYLQYKYNVMPAGSYDLKVEFADGTTKLLTGAVEVLGSGENILTDSYRSDNYDQTGKYLYIELSGWNLKPANLVYTAQVEGIEYTLKYVNHRPTYGGAVVQLEKGDWPTQEYEYYEITSKEMTRQTEVTCYLNVENEAYYLDYNRITGNLEAALSKGLNTDGRNIPVTAKSGYGEEGPVVATGSIITMDGYGTFKLTDSAGNPFPSVAGNYYIEFAVDDQTYGRNIYINDSDLITYTTASDVQEGTSVESAEVSNSCYVDSETGDIVVVTGVPEANMVAKQQEIEEYAASGQKFVLSYVSASWDSKTQMEVHISTANAGTSDKYTVALYDEDGNKVSGLKTEVGYRYSNSVELIVTGLTYENAYKKYYVKVTHNSYGNPVDYNGNEYYTDIKGELMDIGYDIFNSYTIVYPDERMTGMGMSRSEYPTTLYVYKPYSLDVIYKTVVTKDKAPNGWYYFTEDLFNCLPDADGLYDVVCQDSAYNAGGFDGRILGRDTPVVWGWTYEVDKSTLYVNDDSEKTAVITVSGCYENPTYKTTDASILTVKADDTDPEKAIVTAVGVGSAYVIIEADGYMKYAQFEVTRKAFLEGLELNVQTMNLSVGEEAELTASVVPAEAYTEDVIFSFSVTDAEGNESDVVSITHDGTSNIASILANKAGTAKVTATATNSGTRETKTTSCNITVKNAFNIEEKQALIENAGTQYVLLNTFPNATVTLKDIGVPAAEEYDGHWEWIDESIKLTADDTAPIQYFSAKYEEEGYEAFTVFLPVAVSQLTAVSVVGDSNTVVSGDSASFEALGKYKGYQPTDDEFEDAFTYQWTAAGTAPAVTIAEGTDRAKIIELTAKEVEKAVSQVMNLMVTVNGKEFKSSVKVNVIPAPFVDDIEVSVSYNQLDTVILGEFDEENPITEIVIDSSDISTTKDNVHNTLKLYAVSLAGEQVVQLSKGFKWSSSDSSVVTVKADKNNSMAILTFKKAGSALLHVVAQDGGKFDKEILVTIKDYTPILESNKIALDLYTEGGTVIPVVAQNDNAIIGIEILEQDSVTKEWNTSNRLEVSEEDGIFYICGADDYAPSKNENVNVKFKVTTNKYTGENATELAATVNVNVKTKPTASLKAVSKANLFYTDANAVYQISSKYEIASVEDITVDANGNRRGRNEEENGFRLEEVNLIEGKLLFTNGNTLNKDTLADYKAKKSPLCQVTLRVSFAGYTDAADQIITVTVATEEKKPSLKLNDVIIFQGVGESTTQVYDTKVKAEYLLDATYSIDSATNSVTLTRTEAGYVSVAYDGSKGINYKADITSTGWTQTLNLAGKIKVDYAYKQNLVLEGSKITLNKEHNIQNNGTMEIPVMVKNNSAEIQNITYLIDKNNRALFESGYLYFGFDQEQQKIYLGLNKGMGTNIKAGTYKVTVNGTVNAGDYDQWLKSATLSITITDKAPAVTLKAKGSIDLIRRQSTEIVYTPTFKNVIAEARGVSLSGAYADYFKARVEDGKIVIVARENTAMSTKITYPVNVDITMDNGAQVTSTVKIKPVNKLPKLTAKMSKATLYKANPSEVSYQVVTNDKLTSIDRIVRVEDKNSKYFEFEAVGDLVTVSLSDEAIKLKPGKYTISYQVYMEGAAYNVKPTTLKLTVTVK